jgi:hypothetical protein
MPGERLGREAQRGLQGRLAHRQSQIRSGRSIGLLPDWTGSCVVRRA